MASVEFYEKRIAGKQKELEKLDKKLARIRKAESFNWDDDHNPYYYGEDDLRWCLRDIAEAKESLENYQLKLNAEIEKASSRDVQIILDFLDLWKKKNQEFYHRSYDNYLKASEELRASDKAYEEYRQRVGYFKAQDSELSKEHEAQHKAFKEAFGFLCPFLDLVQDKKTFKFHRILNEEKLKKELDEEANRKYDFIIERTNSIVGQITDASNLEIGSKQDLNGYIIGTRGTAKVQTIGAGGYNIQCFHFRTLIHEMK